MKYKHIDTNNINYRLGQNIARLRMENGYSQEAFVLECNISRAYYGQLYIIFKKTLSLNRRKYSYDTDIL